MYYLIQEKQDTDITILEVIKSNDSTYFEIQKKVFKMHGQFGIKQYAEIWMDFRNNKINSEKLKLRLGL